MVGGVVGYYNWRLTATPEQDDQSPARTKGVMAHPKNDHKQDGLAENCIEIHPVLKIAITGQSTGGAIHLPTGVTHKCGSQGGGRGGRAGGRGRGCVGATE